MFTNDSNTRPSLSPLLGANPAHHQQQQQQRQSQPRKFSFELEDPSPSTTTAPINISGRSSGGNVSAPSWTVAGGSRLDDPSGSVGRWDGLDLPPVSSSFRGSYESELSWGGREDADDLDNDYQAHHLLDPDELEYDPVQYDTPNPSPMMLLSESVSHFQDFFTNQDDSVLFSSANYGYSPRGDRLSAANSPASSAGGGDSGNEGGGGGGLGGRHSRASSVSSQRPGIPGSPGMAVNDAFTKLGFDPVELDLQWRKQNSPSPALGKPMSPPALVIPSDTGERGGGLGLPSLFNPSLIPQAQPQQQLGLIPGPSINIVPSTPVSGGGASAAGSNAPFQHILQTLNSAHRGGGASNSSMNYSHSHTPTMPASTSDSTSASQQGRSSSSTTTTSMNLDDWQLPPAPSDQASTYPELTFDFRQQPSNPFPFPSNRPGSSLSSHNPDLLGYQTSTSSRPRSRSDTSSTSRPTWGGMMGAVTAPAGLGGHLQHQQGTVDPNQISSSTSSPGMSSSYHESSNFSQSYHIPPHSSSANDDLTLGTGFGLGMGSAASGVGIRRVKSTGGADGGSRHNRISRSEDFSRGNDMFLLPAARPIVTPDGSLAPGDPRYAGGDFTTIPASGGPSRHSRRGSAGGSGGSGKGSHSRNSSVASSSRVSPYPSPNGSPAHVHEQLPPSSYHPSLPFAQPLGLGNGNGNDISGLDTQLPARSQVTTPATHKASEARRKQEANFACPVPGCGSTFTRHFNLKGHLRSHNDERPFKCKWTGCGKGFARRHDCRRHESLHLNHRPYTCDGCQKTFARMDALNRHLKSEGGIECRSRQQMGDADNSPDEDVGIQMKSEDAGGWGGNSGAGGFIM